MSDKPLISKNFQRLFGTLGVLAISSFSPTASALDLLQIYRLAITHDASYLAAQAAADAGREALPQALAPLLPSLSVSASGFQNKLDQSSPSALGELITYHKNYNSSNLSWNLRQPITASTSSPSTDRPKRRLRASKPRWTRRARISSRALRRLISMRCWPKISCLWFWPNRPPMRSSSRRRNAR